MVTSRDTLDPAQCNRVALAMIEHAAEEGHVCPSNHQFAARLGFSSNATGARIVERLEEMGAIKVYRGGGNVRVVIVTATGKQTAGELAVPRTAWRKPNTRRKNSEVIAEKVAQPRVDRDPCPWCGTRRDFGCRHSGRMVSADTA